MPSFRSKNRSNDLRRKGETQNCSWHALACIRAVAKLSVTIRSKRPDRSVVLHRNAMCAGAYRSYSSKIACNHRSAAICVGAVSKLTTIVVAPGQDRSIAFQSQGMVLTCSNRDSVGDANRLHRYIAIGRRAVAKLTVVVVTPIPHCPVRF